MICGAQGPLAVAKARLQPSIGRRLRGDALSGRETLGMLLEPLDAEEFGTNRLFVGAKGFRRLGFEGTTE